MHREPLSAFHLAAVAFAMALGVLCVAPGLHGPLSFDGGYAYLPMAKKLLAGGWAYLGRPESLATGVMAYAWPAMLGADEALVRAANVFLYAASIGLAFVALRWAHSNRAGVIAAFLMAASPVLHPYIPDVMTEPPFVFGIAVWAVSIAAVMRGHVIGGALAGGMAFALATLTRPATTWFPFIVAAFFAWRAWRARGGERRIDAGLALLHGIAALLIGAVIARNSVEFSYPALATGAGNALFQGVNVLVDGFDPTYYGLTYDDGAVTRGGFHLSIAGDRLLRGTALEELRATPLTVVLAMWGRKATAFVFVGAQEWGAPKLRAWRVGLVVFALAAIFYQRRSRMVMALVLLAGYLVLAHMPLFYLHRYSAALDAPLALLAAIGFVEVLGSAARLAAFAMAGVLATGSALAALAGAGPGSPHPDRSPYEEAWSHAGTTVHATRDTAIEFAVTGAPRLNPSAQMVITMRLRLTPDRHGGCSALRFRYKGLADAGYDPTHMVRIPVRANGRERDVCLGAVAPLQLDREGVLRVEFECDGAATAEIGTMRILEPMRASYYRQRYLDRLQAH